MELLKLRWLISGEMPPQKTVNFTENYDGTSWTTIVQLHGNCKKNNMEIQDQHLHLFSSSGESNTASYTSTTEEYNKSANVITAAAWASGGNLNTGRSWSSEEQVLQTAGALFMVENALYI